MVWKRGIFSILTRYLILIALGVGINVLYFIFTPLTIYPVYFLLDIFFDILIIQNILIIGESSITLIPACVAGSAYYLLLIFNLSVPQIKFSKRIKMILFAFVVFLILNILRIFLLDVLNVTSSSLFDITHKLFWYLISIVFVIGIWFTEVKMFKIKEIPFYSDVKFLYSKSLLKK